MSALLATTQTSILATLRELPAQSAIWPRAWLEKLM
jgi:hypothetical protein